MADDFSLLETMRLDQGQIPRLERHMARMSASAGHFGYPFHDVAVRDALASVRRAHQQGCWRVRLLVDRTGAPTVECTPHTKDKNTAGYAFAHDPVDERDPFLFNKTTHRTVYEQARRAQPDVDDVILWNRRGEVTESTIGNVVVAVDGVRATPPVACGLLGGTFRAELLDSGAIVERVLRRDEVAAAPELWLINSVREWVEARFV